MFHVDCLEYKSRFQILPALFQGRRIPLVRSVSCTHFDNDSNGLVAVCRWTSHLPLRGSFSKRSTGRRVTFTFHYIIYAPASHHTAAKRAFCFAAAAAESNSAPFAALHLNGVCRWTSQLALRGSFSKRSTGRQVDGSTGQTGRQVTSRQCM